jgi:hypothetical protein
MTEPLRPGDGAPNPHLAENAAKNAADIPGESAAGLAVELRQVLHAVEGVQTLYPAQPLWQGIAGAAYSAATGEARTPVAVSISADAVSVKTRIGVSAGHRAPDVARSAASAVRSYLHPRTCAVEVIVVQIGV